MDKIKILTARGTSVIMYDSLKVDELVKEYQIELEYKVKYAGDMKEKIIFKNLLRRHQELFGVYIKNEN